MNYVSEIIKWRIVQANNISVQCVHCDTAKQLNNVIKNNKMLWKFDLQFNDYVQFQHDILLPFPPLHFVVCWLRTWHVSVFSPLPSLSSSGFWPYCLPPGLAISALVCLDFAFHLPSSAISFSWHHHYLTFAHVQTIWTSAIWRIPPSGTCVPLSRCLHFWHDLVSSILLPIDSTTSSIRCKYFMSSS